MRRQIVQLKTVWQTFTSKKDEQWFVIRLGRQETRSDTDACVWVYCLPILLHVMGVQMISIHTNKLQNRKINFIRINGMLLSAFLWFAAGVLSYTKLHSPLEYKWIVWIAFLYLIGHLQCSHSLILCYRRPLLIVMIRRVFLSHRCAQTAIIPFILHWRIPII